MFIQILKKGVVAIHKSHSRNVPLLGVEPRSTRTVVFFSCATATSLHKKVQLHTKPNFWLRHWLATDQHKSFHFSHDHRVRPLQQERQVCPPRRNSSLRMPIMVRRKKLSGTVKPWVYLQGSNSSTFYTRIFRTKANFAAFL